MTPALRFLSAAITTPSPRFTLKTEHDDGIRTKRIFWIDDLVTDKLVQGLDEGDGRRSAAGSPDG